MKIKGAKKKKWALILYLLLAGVLVGLISSLGLTEFTKLSIWIFIAAQVWLLILGILHGWFFEKIIPLENKNLGQILYTMALIFFGYALVILSFKFYFQSPFPRLYLFPAFFFIAPTFVIIAFNNFIKIPEKLYKEWDFPAPGTLADPTDSEMANPIIVNLVIRKQSDDSLTTFKAKAPQAMSLGKLFYFFISDYNSRNPNNPISIENSEKKRFKWSFYQTANIITGNIHFDSELSILENKIKENASVICERI